MNSFNQLNKQNILKSLIMIVAGVTLLLYPQMATNTIAYIIAAIFIINGVIHIVGYFRGPVHGTESEDGLKSYSGGLVIGILSIIFAGLIGWVFVSIIPIILGIIVLISGLIKLEQAVELLRAKEDGWIVILIMAGINIVVGALALFNPFDTANLLVRIIGIGLLFGGVTDLIATGYISKKLGK